MNKLMWSFAVRRCPKDIFGPAAEKRDLRTYANSEDPVQTAHPRSLDWIFAVRLYSIGLVEYIGLIAKIFNRRNANWSGASPFTYDLGAFLSAADQFLYVSAQLSLQILIPECYFIRRLFNSKCHKCAFVQTEMLFLIYIKCLTDF